MIRKSCVDGLFYAGDRDNLRRVIDEYFSSLSEDDNGLGEVSVGIAPHAGYIYSGKTAAYTFNALRDYPADTYVILGPNHTGYGTRIDVCDYDKWETPLGLVDIDVEFISRLLDVDGNVVVDNSAHLREHSIEVEVPFLQVINEGHPFSIVPIVISRQEPDLCRSLAESIMSVARLLDRRIAVIASTDLNHYEDSETSLFLDTKVMDSVKDMDMDRLVKDIVEYDITMCGYGPVITAVTYAKLCDYDSCNVLKYSNSGDVSGDYDSVVGYMSAVLGK